MYLVELIKKILKYYAKDIGHTRETKIMMPSLYMDPNKMQKITKTHKMHHPYLLSRIRLII